MPEIKDKMIEVVNRIPREQVTSYGEVAKVVSDETQRRVTAQLIWRQLSGLARSEWNTLPWWRVVAKSGYISALKLGDRGWKQIQLLEQEEIWVVNNYVDMKEFGIWADALHQNA